MAAPGLYGGDRIVAGARFLNHLDPGWWREDAMLPASLTALDMADPYRCVLAWWAARHLPAPPQRGPRQIPPYDRAMLALCLSSRQAQALGFTGADADLLTPGWRHLITDLRHIWMRAAWRDVGFLPKFRIPTCSGRPTGRWKAQEYDARAGIASTGPSSHWHVFSRGTT